MKVQDLCDLKTIYHKSNYTCQSEVLDFAMNKIHYDYFFDFFGYKMNQYPAIFDYKQIQDIALAFNGYAFCNNDIYGGIYQEYRQKIYDSLFDNPYAHKIQNGENSHVINDYLDQVKDNFLFDMSMKMDYYVPMAYLDLEKNLGSYLYSMIVSNINILLKNYIEDIIMISCTNPYHKSVDDPDLLLAISKVNDPEVLKYVYNCLALTRVLDRDKCHERMPFFVKKQISQFRDVSFELQKHLEHPEEYERVKAVFSTLLHQYCQNHIDGEIYANLSELFASSDYSFQDVIKILSYFTPDSIGTLSLYLVNQKNRLGSKENEVENSVEFLKPEFYSRSRVKNSK